MRLYHGSDKIIKEPQYGFGKKYNDYGMGFYCTEELDMAKEWAVNLNFDGVVNIYNIDISKLSVLNLNSEEYCILDWLTILLKNRHFDIQSDFGKEAVEYLSNNFNVNYEAYDVIRGYRADDSYFSFAQDFINNTISLSTLEKAMKLGKLGEQVVLKSRKAFKSIIYEDSVYVESSIWFPGKEQRDRKARKDYYDLRKQPWKKGELYMMQILDLEIKRDDVRLR